MEEMRRREEKRAQHGRESLGPERVELAWAFHACAAEVVDNIIANGLNLDDNRAVQALSKRDDLVKPAYGLYPVDAVWPELVASGEAAADGDHQLCPHGVVLVVAHVFVEASPNRDDALFPEASEDEHHVAGPPRVRGEDLPVVELSLIHI